jgi:hypothetical protein
MTFIDNDHRITMTIDISSNIVEYHLPPLMLKLSSTLTAAAYGDGSIFRLPHDLLVIFDLDRSCCDNRKLNSSIPITLILCGKIIVSVQFYLSSPRSSAQVAAPCPFAVSRLGLGDEYAFLQQTSSRYRIFGYLSPTLLSQLVKCSILCPCSDLFASYSPSSPLFNMREFPPFEGSSVLVSSQRETVDVLTALNR